MVMSDGIRTTLAYYLQCPGVLLRQLLCYFAKVFECFTKDAARVLFFKKGDRVNVCWTHRQMPW